MLSMSENFVEAMKTKPFIARITLDGRDVIEGDAVQLIDFGGGTSDNDQAATVGSAVAGSVEITLQKELVNTSIAGREMFVELGLSIGGSMEWCPMGTYSAGDVTEDDGQITVPGLDAMAAKFDRDYEALSGFNFAAGVDSLAFMRALCARRGVTVDLSGLSAVTLKVDPVGFTERKIIGMLAALYGKFAYIDRYGTLRFRWYEPVKVAYTPDDYYADGMEKASYGFTAGWLKCFVDSMEETLCEGDSNAKQGIYCECTWMTEDILAGLWAQLRGFSYNPVTLLSIQGDPRLEPGDIVYLTDGRDEGAMVPIMSLRQEFDGGLKAEISAPAKLETESYEGPVTRQVRKTLAQIIKRQNEIELSIKTPDGSEIIAAINLTDEKIKIQAGNIALEGIVTANGYFKVLEDGSIEAAAGTIGGCTINNGVLQIKNINVAEKLKAAKIDVDDLFAKDINVSGTFAQTATVFFEPGQPELDRMYAGISVKDPFTAAEVALYDFDNDGVVTMKDYLTAYRAMSGAESLAEWSGAVKTIANVTIDLKNPQKAIRISGTNMWGRKVEKCFGLNMAFADGNVEDTFNTILQQCPAFQELKDKVSALENR